MGDHTDMRNLLNTTRKRLMPLLAASVLLTGGVGTSLLFTGGTADAETCVAGVGCSVGGTLTLTSGAMNLAASPTLGWGTAISGADQALIDTTTTDETYTVLDATG